MVLTIGGYYPVIPPANMHTRRLPYGMINCATRGLFLGERHLYFIGQPDDVLSWGDRWNVATHTTIFDDGYRNEPQDIDDIVTWMAALLTTAPNAADFKMETPFNGEGSLADREGGDPGGAITAGSLTAKIIELESEFVWLNHTYSHTDLDAPADYALVEFEIGSNADVATTLGFSDYTSTTLASISNFSVALQGADMALSWTATTLDTQGDPLGALVYRVYRGSMSNFAITPEAMIAEVSDANYVDVGAADGGYTYAVAAVGDDCWKRESDVTRPAPTFVQVTGLGAGSALSLVMVPAAMLALVAWAIVWSKTQMGR